jgi:hypothetical protein
MFVPQENRPEGDAYQKGIITEVLDGAEFLLRKDGWINKNPVLAGSSKHCIAQALALASHGHKTVKYDVITQLMLRAIHQYTGKMYTFIPTYNDSACTEADVWQVFKLARDLAQK